MKKWILMISILFGFMLFVSCTPQTDHPEDEDPIDIIDEEPEEEPEEEPTEEELRRIQATALLNTLSLEQKIGQMFIVGFNGTSMPSSLSTAINQYYFGNFIYFGANVADDTLVPSLSTAIQNEVVSATGIPGFISMDQEGGMVVRFANHATHFIGNMGLVATQNPENAYWVGKYTGQELRHYGVNLNLAPVLDVNNNPANPVIGIRSYSDDPDVVSAYGTQMIRGLTESGVMATGKHFPGHGDTSVDSHYGLPLIPHSLDRLYDVELVPYIDAIEAGIDAIMTAHIVFSAIDTELPATLSHPIVTGLLREDLGYDGIIMTDAMGMNAISTNFGVQEAAVLAVNAGVDMLLYAESTTLSVNAYTGVLNAVNQGDILISRINEAVLRILMMKFKYGLIDDYLPKNNLTTNDFNMHNTFNQTLLLDSITMAKGTVSEFDPTKSTLFISSICTRYPLLPGYTINTTNNSLAYVAYQHFLSTPMASVGYEVVGTSLTSTQINSILTRANDYDQVVIALENVSTSQANLVNELQTICDELIVVALRNPYDILFYNNVQNYICTYGYFASSVQAIFSYLKGEIEVTGHLPVVITGLND